ncbi:MAG: hypothetical protein SVC26_01095 [Pseudomonadota bacterium]|nr:hypothetical protein [Pseudomonadota bacterium]
MSHFLPKATAIALAVSGLVACDGSNGGSTTTTPTTPEPGVNCPADFSTDIAGSDAQCLLNPLITADAELTSDIEWLLSETVFVGEGNVELDIDEEPASSAVLTIQAGTSIKGAEGAALVITRGSKIMAMGTAAEPITMSSLDANFENDDKTTTGEWGGLAIMGYATINKCDQDTAIACNVDAEGGFAFFGGHDDTDNSGEINYVRIAEGGGEVGPADDGNDLNGLTLFAVGSGTKINNVQIHDNYDDGAEFFGGTVDVTNLVVTASRDDSVDWDNGYRGTLTNLYIEQDNEAESSDKSGMELDSWDEPRTEDLPISDPTVDNFAIVGLNDLEIVAGIKLRDGSRGSFSNGQIFGFDTCIDIENDNGGSTGDSPFDSAVAYIDGNLTFNNVAVSCNTAAEVTKDELASSIDFSDITTNLEVQPVIGDVISDTSWLLAGTFGATTPAPTCPENISTAVEGTNQCILNPLLAEDATLRSNFEWILEETVFVGEGNVELDIDQEPASSAVLTIEAGTSIKGAEGAALVITRGSKIMAMGTAAEPITMSSLDANFENDNKATTGEWGGLAIMGYATINKCDQDTAIACNVDAEGGFAFFGGHDDTDSSGEINYVRIAEGGGEVGPADDGNDLNGLTLFAVGSGTKINNVQIHDNYDDGAEFFGGTVDVTNLVVTASRDDSVDWDNGYRGTLTNVFIKQDNEAESSDKSGMELDSWDEPRTEDLPISDPTVDNFAIVGLDDSVVVAGIKLRDGSRGSFLNGQIFGFDTCIDIENDNGGSTGDSTFDSAVAYIDGNLTFTDVEVSCATAAEVTKDELASSIDFSAITTGLTVEPTAADILDSTDWLLEGTF